MNIADILVGLSILLVLLLIHAEASNRRKDK